MTTYQCRNNTKAWTWTNVKAGHEALAAQLYAEDTDAQDGDEIEVKGEGKFIVTKRVVINPL